MTNATIKIKINDTITLNVTGNDPDGPGGNIEGCEVLSNNEYILQSTPSGCIVLINVSNDKPINIALVLFLNFI